MCRALDWSADDVCFLNTASATPHLIPSGLLPCRHAKTTWEVSKMLILGPHSHRLISLPAVYLKICFCVVVVTVVIVIVVVVVVVVIGIELKSTINS